MGDDGTMTKGTRYTPEFKASAPNRLHVADITYVRMAGPTGSRTIPTMACSTPAPSTPPG